MSTGTKSGRKPAVTPPRLKVGQWERESRRSAVWEWRKDWPSLVFRLFIIQKAPCLIFSLCQRWVISNCAVKVKQLPSLLLWRGRARGRGGRGPVCLRGTMRDVLPMLRRTIWLKTDAFRIRPLAQYVSVFWPVVDWKVRCFILCVSFT